VWNEENWKQRAGVRYEFVRQDSGFVRQCHSMNAAIIYSYIM